MGWTDLSKRLHEEHHYANRVVIIIIKHFGRIFFMLLDFFIRSFLQGWLIKTVSDLHYATATLLKNLTSINGNFAVNFAAGVFL